MALDLPGAPWGGEAGSDGVEVRAGRTDLLRFRGVGGREVLGVRHGPADNAAGLRGRPRLRPEHRMQLPAWLAGRSEGTEVAAEALDIPGESALAQFAVELGNVVPALQSAGMKTGLVLVRYGQSSGGFDQQFVEAAGPGEATDGGVVQPQRPAIAASDLPSASSAWTASYLWVVRATGPRGRPLTSRVPSGVTNGTTTASDGSGVTRSLAVASAVTEVAANAARRQPW
ncbi:hypothetical protein [Streptomyces sp. NPDC017868]|uniref:hypothetical protein n=1 Tax=Streptomyces sp. NPDC017868 TaxID=3365014 RepID=UPI0037B9E103